MDTEFAPVAALSGGALIGLAAVLLMAATGRIAGISGIAARILPPYRDGEFAGRLVFVAGLIAAPVLLAVLGQGGPVEIAAGPGTLVLAGLLVGFGTVWGSGCTSGHGVCGLARLSVRSAVAVAVFMCVAVLTVFVVRHLA